MTALTLARNRTRPRRRMRQPPSLDLLCLLLGSLLLGLLCPFYALYWGPALLLVVIPAGLLADLALREIRRSV